MSLADDLNEFFADGSEVIVAEPLKFKAKLGIGERAYTSLRARENMSTFSEALGVGTAAASVAGSTTVAGTFFASTGFLSTIGLGAAAATPIGWVIAAGVISGGAYMGVSRLLEKRKDNGLIVIPKYINTPLDVIAVALIEIMLPVSLKIAKADGIIQDSELKTINAHFSDEWGYSSGFVNRLINEYQNQTDNVSYSALAKSLGTYCSESKDCDKQAIMTGFIEHLREIIESDGKIHPQEREQLDYLTSLLINQSEKTGGRSVVTGALKTASRGLSRSSEITSNVLSSAGGATATGFKSLKTASSNLASKSSELASTGLGRSMRLASKTGDSFVKGTRSLKDRFSKKTKT